MLRRQCKDALLPRHAHTGAGIASAGSPTMNIRNENEIKERRLAHQIRTALDASANRVPPDIADRLAAARRIALGHKKAEAAVAAPRFALPGGHGDPFAEPTSASQRV